MMCVTTSQIQPTVGLNIGRLEIKNSSIVLWDLGGQAGLRGIWDNYFAEAHAIIWVVDAADASRLQEVPQRVRRLQAEAEP